MDVANAKVIVATAQWDVFQKEFCSDAANYATTYDPHVTAEVLQRLGIMKTHYALEGKPGGAKTVYGIRNLQRLKAAGADLPDIPDRPGRGLS